MSRILTLQPLTADAFARFGDVIEPGQAKRVFSINEGTAQRHHDLARIEPGADGRVALGWVQAQPRALPFAVRMLERHPRGSQAFVPLGPACWIVVVADAPEAEPLAFLAERGQGANYAPGVWHHPLIALDAPTDFLVVDREGPGDNCDEVGLPEVWTISG